MPWTLETYPATSCKLARRERRNCRSFVPRGECRAPNSYVEICLDLEKSHWRGRALRVKVDNSNTQSYFSWSPQEPDPGAMKVPRNRPSRMTCSCMDLPLRVRERKSEASASRMRKALGRGAPSVSKLTRRQLMSFAPDYRGYLILVVKTCLDCNGNMRVRGGRSAVSALSRRRLWCVP